MKKALCLLGHLWALPIIFVTLMTVPLSSRAQPDAGSRVGPPDSLIQHAGVYRIGEHHLLAVAPFRAGKQFSLLLADAQTDQLRLLFPAPGEGFVTGAELAQPEPVEWNVTFKKDPKGAVTELVVRPQGSGPPLVARKLPLRTVDVRFRRDDTAFEGTLYLPRQRGRLPAVVLAHGSEESDRYSFGPIPYVLAARGFAVLAYDKRGTGRSGGDWKPEGLEPLAADLVAAIDMLASRKEIDPERLAVLGMSEGGWVAPLAASMSPRIRAIAAISGGARTKGDAFVHKVRRERQAAGDTGAALDSAGQEAEKAIADSRERVRQNRDASGFDKRVTYDPTEHWRRFRGPVLYMGGEADVLESGPEAVAWFHRLFTDTGHPDFTLRLWPRAHHSLLLGVTGEPSEFRTLRGVRQLAPGYWDVLVHWLETRLTNHE